MKYVSIPAIAIICYMIGEVVKHFILKQKKKYKIIPVVVGISGGVLGLLAYYISPQLIFYIDNPIMATAIGIMSGLSSTGGNQVLKQLLKEENQNEGA